MISYNALYDPVFLENELFQRPTLLEQVNFFPSRKGGRDVLLPRWSQKTSQCEEWDELASGGHGSFTHEANPNFATDSDKKTHSCYTLILRNSWILKDLQNRHYSFLHNGFELDLIFQEDSLS